MDKFILPPCPSWFLSNILSCNDDGLLAYGSRTEIVIVKLKPDGKFEVSLINFSHKEKIHAVIFSPKNGSFSNCLATCGDDSMVRVWDFTNSRLLLCHSGHKVSSMNLNIQARRSWTLYRLSQKHGTLNAFFELRVVGQPTGTYLGYCNLEFVSTKNQLT